MSQKSKVIYSVVKDGKERGTMTGTSVENFRLVQSYDGIELRFISHCPSCGGDVDEKKLVYRAMVMCCPVCGYSFGVSGSPAGLRLPPKYKIEIIDGESVIGSIKKEGTEGVELIKIIPPKKKEEGRWEDDYYNEVGAFPCPHCAMPIWHGTGGTYHQYGEKGVSCPHCAGKMSSQYNGEGDPMNPPVYS